MERFPTSGGTQPRHEQGVTAGPRLSGGIRPHQQTNLVTDPQPGLNAYAVPVAEKCHGHDVRGLAMIGCGGCHICQKYVSLELAL